MKKRTVWLIVEVIVAVLLVIFLLISTKAHAQESAYYSPISEKQYNKIAMGDMFYEGQIQLTDGTWHKGWLARFPDSNQLRFRSLDDSTHVFTLTSKYVKSFTYNIKDTIPFFVFKEVPLKKRRPELIAIEIIIKGELTLYIHKTVRKIGYWNHFFQNKYEFQMLMDFYVEKNGELYKMEDFERDLAYLIKDKEDVFDFYKKTKKLRRKNDYHYKSYINTITHYNETKIDGNI